MQVWKTIRIFISSTFRDMHAERDFLVRFVFPELRERCAKRNLHLIDVDLRWGVTEEESKQGKVIEICFDEIERCRPFFIGLLGERYGWTPEKFEVSDDEKFDWLNEYRGHSVTALEIYHGVLRDEEMKTRAFFYFRDADFLKDVPEKERADFLPESNDAAQKLEDLKKEIKAKCSVFENYPCTYDGIDEKGKAKLADLEELFGKRVLEDLWTAICLEHPEDETPPDDLAIERSFHETFIENRTTRFIGRRDVLDKLNEFADGEDENSLVVTGAAGCGKSAVLAKFAKEYAEKHAEDFVLTHFIGVSPGSTDVRRTLLRLCRELKRKFDIQEEIPTDYYELRQAFVKFLEKAAERGKVLFVLDALNQLEESHFAHHLDWLPQDLPNGVKVIVSTLEGDYFESLRRRNPQPREVLIGSLTEAERREIFTKTLKTYRKTLDENQMRLLLAKNESDNPLFLIVACEELRVYGEFDTVSVKLESLAEQVETLFGQVLERVEYDHGKELVMDALVLLECSRHGLLESEMLELLKRDGEKQLPQAVWARFYRSIQFYLRPPGESGEGLLDFFHRQLAKAVRNRYLTDGKTEIASHQRLARYFQRKADPQADKTWTRNYSRGLSELSHHQLAGKLYKDLFQTARDETFLTKQSEIFADDPELQLQTLQNAITGAAEIDDATKMGEFVLSHARRVQSMRDESPLDALRKGNLERAWKLADLYEIEYCVLWYLLLAWELTESGQTEKSNITLEQIKDKRLPKLSDWQGEYAGFLLCQVSQISKESFEQLRDYLLNDYELKLLCAYLAETGNFSEAIETSELIDNEVHRVESLGEIARYKILSGDLKSGRKIFAHAVNSAQNISNYFVENPFLKLADLLTSAGVYLDLIETGALTNENWDKDPALLKIIQAHSEDSQFTKALETIELLSEKDAGLLIIVKAYVRERMFDEASEIINQVTGDVQKVEALTFLAKSQREAGNVNFADQNFTSAIDIIEQIEFEENKIAATKEIAIALIDLNQFNTALDLFNKSLDLVEVEDQTDYLKVDCIMDVVKILVKKNLVADSFELFCNARMMLETLLNEIDLSEWEERYSQDRPLAKRKSIQREFAEVLVENNYLEEAFVFARPDYDPYYDSELETFILEIICKKQCRENHFSEAIETAFCEPNEELRGNFLKDIAFAQKSVNQKKSARTTLAKSINIKAQNNYVNYRERTLSEIVAFQSQFLNIETALSIATQIENTGDNHGFYLHRDNALKEIAKAQASLGKVSESLQTLELISDLSKDETLEEMIPALANSGKFVQSINLIEKLGMETSKIKGLCGIAKAYAESGDFVSANNTFQIGYSKANSYYPENEGYELSRNDVLLQIISAQAESGLFSEAIDGAEQFLDGLVKAEALCKIAKLQLKAKKKENATQTFLKAEATAKKSYNIHSENSAYRPTGSYYFRDVAYKGFEESRARILWEIVIEQIDIDDLNLSNEYLTKAFEIAKSIKDTNLWSETLRIVAKIEAQTGMLPAALEKKEQIKDKYLWSQTLIEIAKLQPQSGKTQKAQSIFDEAINTADGIEEGWRKTEVFREIAKGQVQIGLNDEALQTTDKILTERSENLQNVACAFVEHNNKSSFKQLLIPTAFYTDAAYKICGLLVRLYPEQSLELVDIINRTQPLLKEKTIPIFENASRQFLMRNGFDEINNESEWALPLIGQRLLLHLETKSNFDTKMETYTPSPHPVRSEKGDSTQQGVSGKIGSLENSLLVEKVLD